MSKSEILAELPKLNPADRRNIFDQLCNMEERELFNGVATPAEKKLLDRESAACQSTGDPGSTWEAVGARICKPSCT
jgi:hypothetical protein